MNISIYDKKGKEIVSAVVGSNSYVFTQIMGDNYLQLEFKHSEFVKIDRYAYVVYNSVKYTLIEAVVVEQVSTVEWNFSARFEAPQKLLDNIMMSHMAGENQVSTKEYERDFSLAGTALEHLQMLWRNTDRLKATFVEPIEDSVASYLTGVKVVAYNNVSCLSALQLIANQFECEWYVTGNEGDGYSLHLGKCSFDENNPTKIAYGFGNGILPNTKKQLHKDAVKMTHICVQGGTQNINTLSQLTDKDGNVMNAYSFKTLHLPLLLNAVDGVGRIYYDVKNNKFDGETGFNSAYSVLLTIDRKANTMTSSLWNAEEDDIIEKAYDLSEFYPKKVRNISSWGFNANNTEFWIKDESIEEACNYNTYQLGGEKITIEFQTGALAGKSFDVIKYNHDEKKFECSLADYDTISMPASTTENAMWRPVDGDEFIVFGCSLPTTYFRDTTTDPFSGAEWDMCRRTASILCDNFEDKFAFSFTIDSNWLSRRTAEQRAKLRTGYWVHYVDSNLCGGGADIRITDVKQYLLKPYQPELTIGDEVKTVSTAQKLTQISSSVSATYNYVQNVQQEAQQAIQQVEEKAFTQVQSDWEEEDETKASFIQNKPEVLNGKDGKDGANGKDGTSAGFGSVTASIDANIGTPSVEVTTSGTNTAKNFSFTFHNLKGAKGDTGATGANGRDGIDGKDGKDGSSVSILGSYDTESALKTAHPTGSLGDAYIVGLDLYVWNGSTWLNVGQIKGEDGNDGKDGTNGTNGKDGVNGVSCTHVWNGTTLTITSASGTSSVDLKGAKGDKGDTGANGADGKDGKDAVPLIDTSFPDSASDERVPSTKLVKTQLAGKSSTGHKHPASDITSGTLAVARGGTGKTTLRDACKAFISALSTGTNTPTDADYVVVQDSNNTLRKPVSVIWTYIKSKADLVYSALNHTHDDRYYTEDEVTTKLSGKSDTSHNHDSVYEKKVTRWNAYEGVSGTGNQYIIFATITHTPKAHHEWSFSVRIRGEHNSMHGETTLRVYGTDANSTTIINPTMTYLEGSKSMPIVRAYRVSDTELAFGIFKANEWAKCSIELLSVVSTSVTAVSSQTDTRTNDTAYLSQVSQTEFSKIGHTHSKSDITDFPSLSAVATSGKYEDLTGKPSIPDVSAIEGMGFGKREVFAIKWSKNTSSQSVFEKVNAEDSNFTLLSSTADTHMDIRVSNCSSASDYSNFYLKNEIRMIKRQTDGSTLTDRYNLLISTSIEIDSDGAYLSLGVNMSVPVNPTTDVPTYIYIICDKLI